MPCDGRATIAKSFQCLEELTHGLVCRRCCHTSHISGCAFPAISSKFSPIRKSRLLSRFDNWCVPGLFGELGASSLEIESARIMADSSLKLPRTLCFFLQAVCGQSITLELRNKLVVRGVLDSVDPRMKYVGNVPPLSSTRL